MLSVVVGACGSCDGARIDGPTPYAPCLVRSPTTSGTLNVGALSLHTEERTLTIEGAPSPLVIAAFSGPGSGSVPSAERFARLAKSGAGLGVLLGDLGDTKATREGLVAGLARLPFPTLIVAGGRDRPEEIAGALGTVGKGAARVIDVTGMRRVQVGSDTFVPVAGAPSGRYGRTDAACGFGLQHLKQLSDDLGAVNTKASASRRWLLAWHAPGGGGPLGVARTAHGVDVGDADLAELARRIGAGGGLFAWPEVQTALPRAAGGKRALAVEEPSADLRMVVPRISGHVVTRSDGSRAAAGFALLRLTREGLALLGIHD